MDARTLKRLGFYLLVAALATGCTPRRVAPLIPLAPSEPGTFATTPNTNPGGAAAPADTIPGGTVVAAGGTGAAQPAAPVVQTPQPPIAPPGPIAMPRPLPGTPGGADPQQPPAMTPPASLPGAPQSPAKADPHLRNTPTAAGGRLGLAPYEVPTDRVVELTLHLERLLAENRNLGARIKELETTGLGREQALAEAMREVEAVNADAARTRATLQAQIAALQGKIKQLEEEDIIFLRAVIEALGRLLPPERKP